MNAKFCVFAICVKAIIYLLLHNLHDCTFNLTKVVPSQNHEDTGKLIQRSNNYSVNVSFFREQFIWLLVEQMLLKSLHGRFIKWLLVNWLLLFNSYISIIFIIFDLTLRLFISLLFSLKVRSWKLYNNKYIIASTQITKTEILAFIGALIFK